MMKFDKNSAPILVVLGQSNACAPGTKLSENEVVHEPMKNVFGLNREHNQAYGLGDVTWTGFTTNGTNLGETRDDTACLSNLFAKMWQDAIDNGADLPDLYVIHISICAQGVAEVEINGWNMWYSMRDPVMKPGTTDVCDISLYPLTTEILSLATMNLIAAGKKPQVIGLHWNQWETECLDATALSQAKDNYENLFWGLFTALGSNKTGKNVPLYLYRPLTECYERDRMDKIIEIFEGFAKTYDDCRILDLRKSSMYDPDIRTHGIFQADAVHYTDQSQRWFAKEQWNDIFGR